MNKYSTKLLKAKNKAREKVAAKLAKKGMSMKKNMKNAVVALLCMLVGFGAVGCVSDHSNPSTSQPSKMSQNQTKQVAVHNNNEAPTILIPTNCTSLATINVTMNYNNSNEVGTLAAANDGESNPTSTTTAPNTVTANPTVSPTTIAQYNPGSGASDSLGNVISAVKRLGSGASAAQVLTNVVTMAEDGTVTTNCVNCSK